MEISESAWANAKEIVHEMGFSKETLFVTNLYEIAARAIHQERRECADIALKWVPATQDTFSDYVAEVCEEISQAIRNK